MSEPIWLLRSTIEAMHDAQLVEHGGAPGVRDVGGLETVLARPQNRDAYGETDLCELAAAYGFGIARNRPFVDGNKRMALLAAFVFLRINGLHLVVDEAGAAASVLALAAGQMTEGAFADWLRAHVRRA